jgi:lysozyme
MARIVDISSNNADPDFRRLRRSGVAGVYIKASEGTSYTNPHAKRCYDAAGGGRLARGFYHFARPDQNPGAAGARREAQHFVSVMRSMHGGRHACKRGNLVPVLDYEVRPAESDWRDAFMDEVWKLCGHEVMLYTSPGFNQWRPVRHKRFRRLWSAHYFVRRPMRTGGYKTYDLHQFTDRAVIPGAHGTIDCSRTRLPGLLGLRCKRTR